MTSHAQRVDALAMLELSSVASGLRVLDAMVKKSPVAVLEANLVEPGRYLILFGGGVAEAEASYEEGLEVAGASVVARMFLPHVHSGVLRGLRGHDQMASAVEMDTLGVVEGTQVAPTLQACDRALKDAAVELTGIRVCGSLGGRAYFVVHGPQHDVEAALHVAGQVLDGHGGRHRIECIPRPHEEMVMWLLRPTPFGTQLVGQEG